MSCSEPVMSGSSGAVISVIYLSIPYVGLEWVATIGLPAYVALALFISL